jgi:hypothetical protein
MAQRWSTMVAAGGVALSSCPLAAQAFALAGSAVSRPESAASFRGAGAASFQIPVQGEKTANASSFSLVCGAALAGAAAAVAGRRGRNTTARKAGAKAAVEAEPEPPKWDKATELGAQAPLGFWDPLGFCEDEEKFKDFRAKELKHGRLAMMGAVGMLTQSIVQVPGMEGVPKNVSAIANGNGLVGGVAIFAIIGLLEAVVFVQDPKKEPGNFGNPFPLIGDDYSMEMRGKELNNGRMAMGSAATIIFVSLFTGKSAIQQFGLDLDPAPIAEAAAAAAPVAAAAAPAGL